MNMKRASQKWAAAVLLAAVLLGCFPAGVFAQETADEPGSGWLVRLQEDTVGLLSEEESQALTAIHAETGLYRTEDPEAVAELQASGLVDYAEPDGVAVLLEGDADPLAKEQWYLDTLGAAAAWESGLAGDGVTVAIIDSGLNAGHEDLSQANILSGWNVLTDSDDVTDTVGHGTFIAGLLAAGRDNGIGISGLTPQVELVPIQCFSDGNRTSVSYIIAAIYLAVDRYGSDVINLSLGTETPSQSLTDAVTYALEHGAIVVSAVGNTGGTQYLYPAADSRVVGVGSVGQTLGVSSFSRETTASLWWRRGNRLSASPTRTGRAIPAARALLSPPPLSAPWPSWQRTMTRASQPQNFRSCCARRPGIWANRAMTSSMDTA